MKRILSILAVITGAVYLISGISVLAFQDVVKVAMGYGAEYEADLLRVYPIQNILELAVMGIPCVVLGFLSMPESTCLPPVGGCCPSGKRQSLQCPPSLPARLPPGGTYYGSRT